MDFHDKLTKFFNACIGLLITKYPTRTSIGFLLGVIIMGMSDFIESLFKLPILHFLDKWVLILLGVFIAHIRTFIAVIFNKEEFDEDIENAFKAIERAGKKGMPVYQRNLAYKRLCEVVLENLDTKLRE
ncbi:MAG: hypothetical protein GY858_04340 [Candidatus Omnitrophica bacterium]|nr:hypothetical protein [Candidatus Omnitrophota bacterium]